jgi:hypothetical protein
VTDRIDFGGKPWNAIPRAVLRDAKLSPRAKGGLVTLLSHEEGWVRSCIGTLQRECDCGRDQAQAIMKELVKAGYSTRQQKNGADGRFTTFYTVTPFSAGSEASTVGLPPTGSPSTVEPATGSPFTVVEAPDVEPLDVDTQSKDLAPRKRNPIYEILFLLEAGLEYSTENNETLTPTSRGALNKAAAEIKGTGISPDELMAAIQAWPIVMGDATCTANAIAKHLPRLRAAARGSVARKHAPTDFDRTMAELERRRQA